MDKLRYKASGSSNDGAKPVVAAPAASPKPVAKKAKSSKKMAVWMLIIIALLAVAGGAYYMYDKYQGVKKENDRLASNPQEAVKKEQENLIAAVGALTELPQGETPTVATVSDASKLSSQTFFANAENGDKVLIYTNAKKAYLYRPSTNKVINIAPVNIGNGANQNSDSSQ